MLTGSGIWLMPASPRNPAPRRERRHDYDCQLLQLGELELLAASVVAEASVLECVRLQPTRPAHRRPKPMHVLSQCLALRCRL